MNKNDDMAYIKPWVFEDRRTGQRIEIRVSPHYSTLHINERVYYFIRETGDFDGLSCPMEDPPVGADVMTPLSR